MSEPLPEVSVVVAAWNAAACVATAIESARAQAGVRVEVIVVDDASTDGTANAARALGADIEVLRLPENRGPGAARNAGFAAARGAWIAVLDADDAMEPGRLRRMLDLGSRTSADVLVDNITIVGPHTEKPMFDRGRYVTGQSLQLDEFVDANTPLKRRYNPGYLKPVFRRAFLQAQGLAYDEALHIGEDYLMLADCLAAGARCVFDGEAGYRYTVGHASISHRLGHARVEAMRRADRRFEKRWRLDARTKAALRRRERALASVSAFAASIEALKERRVGRALLALLRSPAAVLHYREPIAARLRRLFGNAREVA